MFIGLNIQILIACFCDQFKKSSLKIFNEADYLFMTQPIIIFHVCLNLYLQQIPIMANIHRLGENASPNNYRPLGDNNLTQINVHKIPFLYTPPNSTPPLQQSIPITLKITMCPTLKPISFTNILISFLFIMFIIECILGIDVKTSDKTVLSIKPDVLQKLGANMPPLVHEGQVYRLITAAFLHINLAHILTNSLSAWILISRLQACFHWGYLAGLFLISSISGNILSALFGSASLISAGASTALNGYMAAFLAYLIINWQTLAALGPLRGQLTCIIVLIVIIATVISLFSYSVDYYGHLGGFIGGLFGALLILPPIDSNGPKTSKIVGGAVIFVYLLATFLVFFLAAPYRN